MPRPRRSSLLWAVPGLFFTAWPLLVHLGVIDLSPWWLFLAVPAAFWSWVKMYDALAYEPL